MSLVQVASSNDGACVVSLDVDTTDTVRSVSVVNSAPVPVLVEVVRPNGKVLTEEIAPGATRSVNLPPARRFSYSALTSDWGVNLVAVL